MESFIDRSIFSPSTVSLCWPPVLFLVQYPPVKLSLCHFKLEAQLAVADALVKRFMGVRFSKVLDRIYQAVARYLKLEHKSTITTSLEPAVEIASPCSIMHDHTTLVTLNPELLDDHDAFSFRDLQALCKRLSLGGKGKREELVAKLKMWHRHREAPGTPDENKSPLPMNVPGQHFALLHVNVAAAETTPSTTKKKRRRSSLLGALDMNTAEPEGVSPRLLNPLKRVNDNLEAPRSIMKSG